MELRIHCVSHPPDHAVTPLTFPALYTAANRASVAAQARYLNLIRAEYLVLFTASVLAMDFSSERLYLAVYAAVFILGLAILLYRSSTKPEQAWYKSRALAESVKTSTWRYAMRSEPYGFDDAANTTRREFRENLSRILETNEFLGDEADGTALADRLVTPEMDQARALPWESRMALYAQHRVGEQRSWYKDKADFNKKQARLWTIVGACIYALAIGVVIAKIVEPEFEFWPEEPLTVLASALVGWVQIKKFRELASSYSYTALEIGLIAERLAEVADEDEFVHFVNEAEQGFSREHVQWVARQQHGN